MTNMTLEVRIHNHSFFKWYFYPISSGSFLSQIWHVLRPLRLSASGAKHSLPFLLCLAALWAQKQTWRSKYDKICVKAALRASNRALHFKQRRCPHPPGCSHCLEHVLDHAVQECYGKDCSGDSFVIFSRFFDGVYLNFPSFFEGARACEEGWKMYCSLVFGNVNELLFQSFVSCVVSDNIAEILGSQPMQNT